MVLRACVIDNVGLQLTRSSFHSTVKTTFAITALFARGPHVPCEPPSITGFWQTRRCRQYFK